MTRKTGQQDIEQPDERNDVSTVEEFDGGEDAVSASPVQGKIYAFLQRIELEEQIPIYYLSKYENYLSGESKAFIAKFEDCEPPDEHLIGKLYGSGRYLLSCTIPPVRGKKGTTRLYRFRVHPSFDNVAGGPNLPGAQQQMVMIPSAPGHAEPGMVQAFGMMEKLLMMLMPLFNRPRDENVLGILQQNYSSVNDLMKKQMQDNLKMIGDYQRTIADIGDTGTMNTETETETEERPSIIDQFGPLIQQWLPVLLGGGPKAAAAGALVNSVPQVQQIMKDKFQLRQIIAYLDQSNGPDATDKLLSALKIQRIGKRPVSVPVQQVQPKTRKKAG